MYIGNNKVKNMFIGNSPIKSIWLGATKVWEKDVTYTYEIDNVSLYFFPTGTPNKTLLPTASNYATAVGRVRVYKLGVLEQTYTSVKLNVNTLSPYVTTVNNELRFNIDEYGTTDMNNVDNPFYINVLTSYSGGTGPTLSIAVTPNLLASYELIGDNCSGYTGVDYLDYDETSFILYNKNQKTYKTTYTSQMSVIDTQYSEGYLYEVNADGSTYVGTIPANGSMFVSVSSINTTYSPLIHIYNLRNYEQYATAFDCTIVMMQKCQYNTSGMHIYYGSVEVNGRNIEASETFYMANNGHTPSTTYTIECQNNNADIPITEINGVFIVETTSSIYAHVIIRDNSGNTCEFDINM